MKGDIFAIMKFVQFIAHVFEKQPVFLWVDFKPSLQQPQDKLDTSHWNHATLVNIDNVPSVLEVSDISVGQQSVLFVGVEQGKVLHDNSCRVKSLNKILWSIFISKALSFKTFLRSYPQEGSTRYK